MMGSRSANTHDNNIFSTNVESREEKDKKKKKKTAEHPENAAFPSGDTITDAHDDGDNIGGGGNSSSAVDNHDGISDLEAKIHFLQQRLLLLFKMNKMV